MLGLGASELHTAQGGAVPVDGTRTSDRTRSARSRAAVFFADARYAGRAADTTPRKGEEARATLCRVLSLPAPALSAGWPSEAKRTGYQS